MSEKKSNKKKKQVDKEFGISSWAIDNPTVIYVIMALLLVMGGIAYYTMPRESFPEINETKIYISAPYPGNTAEDVEKLITDPLEDRLKNISGVVEILSTSQENYALITVEFEDRINWIIVTVNRHTAAKTTCATAFISPDMTVDRVYIHTCG